MTNQAILARAKLLRAHHNLALAAQADAIKLQSAAWERHDQHGVITYWRAFKRGEAITHTLEALIVLAESTLIRRGVTL